MDDYISRKSAVDVLTKVALRVADSKRRTVATCINEIELLPAIGSYDRMRELIAAQYTPMAPKFYRFSDFGKTVFLTREEAEKALEELK